MNAQPNPRDVVADGEAVRVPLQFMDSTQRAVAASIAAPSWAAADRAREDYLKYIKDAWKGPASTAPAAPDGAPQPPRSAPVGDRREAARAEYERWLSDAWKGDAR